VVKSAVVHVVAGVLSDDGGRVLLAQRPPGKDLAGLWEFPGGKREPGEAPHAALRRELHEELGVDIGAIEKLIAVPWSYPGKSIVLDVYRVLDYAGKPLGREGQAMRWVAADDLTTVAMPPADVPVMAALRLPQRYLITPEPGADHAAFLRAVACALAAGEKLIQLRSKRSTAAALRALAAQLRAMTRDAGAKLLINGRIDLAQELTLDGVHLPASDLMGCVSRPLPPQCWVGASCHNESELAHAAAIGADFAVLGPVLPTLSHPQQAALGWPRFAELCAQASIPVFALGGMQRGDLRTAICMGAQGIAGISALWPG
jgi:8-oxo-dGTP diphosphatase